MGKYILDTNVFIHAIRHDDARSALATWQRRMAPHIFQHAVVAFEILVGARDRATVERWHQRWIAPAERIGRVIHPTWDAWIRAATMVARLQDAGIIQRDDVPPGFQNDCLIAASARDHGYTVVTHNARDFSRIKRVEPALEFVLPFP